MSDIDNKERKEPKQKISDKLMGVLPLILIVVVIIVCIYKTLFSKSSDVSIANSKALDIIRQGSEQNTALEDNLEAPTAPVVVEEETYSELQSQTVTEPVTVPESPSDRYTLAPDGEIFNNYYGDYITISQAYRNGYVLVTWDDDSIGVLDAVLVYVADGVSKSISRDTIDQIDKIAIFKVNNLSNGTYGIFLGVDDYSILTSMDVYLLKEDEYKNLVKKFEEQSMDSAEDLASYRPFGDFVRELSGTHIDSYMIDFATTKENFLKNISTSANKGLLFGLTD